MHHLIHLLAQSTTSTTAGKNTKSSGSYLPLLVIAVIFLLVYFLFLRPRQQRLRQQQTAAKELSVGDQVMSAGGIYGRVVALDADEVEVEVAPGVVMTFTRRAINPRPQPAGGPTAAQPVDEPWNPPEPDGPGDKAGPDTGSGGVTGEESPPAGGPAGA